MGENKVFHKMSFLCHCNRLGWSTLFQLWPLQLMISAPLRFNKFRVLSKALKLISVWLQEVTKKETRRLEKQRLISSRLVVEFCNSSWILHNQQTNLGSTLTLVNMNIIQQDSGSKEGETTWWRIVVTTSRLQRIPRKARLISSRTHETTWTWTMSVDWIFLLVVYLWSTSGLLVTSQYHIWYPRTACF